MDSDYGKKINNNPFKYKSYDHLWFSLILPAYLAAFFIEEKLITVGKYMVHLPFDDVIPFCEWFAPFYVLWYPLLFSVGLYLMFRDANGFKKYMSFIGISFFTVVIIYAVFPNMQDLRPEYFKNNNILIQYIKFLYSIDTNVNVCPSVHVIGSLAAIFAVYNCESLKNKYIKLFTVLTATMISVSTVFIKQHSVLDILIAVPYSFIIYFLVYKTDLKYITAKIFNTKKKKRPSGYKI